LPPSEGFFLMLDPVLAWVKDSIQRENFLSFLSPYRIKHNYFNLLIIKEIIKLVFFDMFNKAPKFYPYNHDIMLLIILNNIQITIKTSRQMAAKPTVVSPRPIYLHFAKLILPKKIGHLAKLAEQIKKA
jgi:hypothetical protein